MVRLKAASGGHWERLRGKVVGWFGSLGQAVSWVRLFRFAVAFAIATGLWYLIKLNNTYTVDFDSPLELISPPKGYMLSGQSRDAISLRVSGHGYALVRYRRQLHSSPCRIPLSELLTDSVSASHQRICFNRSELEAQVRGQIPVALTFHGVEDERICFNLSRYDSRTLPILPAVTYTLRSQHAQFEPNQLSVDSVTVSGPEAALAEMQYAVTDTLRLGELSKTVYTRLHFPRAERLTYNPPWVDYKIPVAQYATKRFRIPILVDKNLPQGVSLRLLPSTVELRCDLPLSEYASVQSEDFQLQVKLPSVGMPDRLLVELLATPSQARGVAFAPQYVDYLITRR